MVLLEERKMKKSEGKARRHEGTEARRAGKNDSLLYAQVFIFNRLMLTSGIIVFAVGSFMGYIEGGRLRESCGFPIVRWFWSALD
jgi:hypothetical protein